MFLLTVCFVTAHPGSAEHFAEFSKVCEERQIPHQVFAGQSVSSKFAIPVIEIEPSDLSTIQEAVSDATCVITDVASEKWAELHLWLAKEHPEIRRICYYENPEPYVPGGYSETAAKVIESAQEVFFANKHLACGVEPPVDLSGKVTKGIGFYNRKNADQILHLKKDPAQLLSLKNSVTDPNNKILVYIGGANKAYYEEAFPHFVGMLLTTLIHQPEILENTTFLLQQHPRAKAEGNRDAMLLEQSLAQMELPNGFQMLISPLSTVEVLAIADKVLYFQTSMAAEFAMAKVPLIAQVGHEPFPDVLMRAGYLHLESFAQLLHKNLYENLEQVEEQLGIDPNWRENLVGALQAKKNRDL